MLLIFKVKVEMLFGHLNKVTRLETNWECSCCKLKTRLSHLISSLTKGCLVSRWSPQKIISNNIQKYWQQKHLLLHVALLSNMTTNNMDCQSHRDHNNKPLHYLKHIQCNLEKQNNRIKIQKQKLKRKRMIYFSF